MFLILKIKVQYFAPVPQPVPVKPVGMVKAVEPVGGLAEMANGWSRKQAGCMT